MPTAGAHTRTHASATLDALPDALAALACAIAWASPQALGFDLLASAAPLYFVELPLALIAAYAGVRRVREGVLSRGTKARFILVPTLVLALMGGALLGPWGLVAILWLGGLMLGRLLWGRFDTSPDVPGWWLVFRTHSRNGEPRFEMTTQRPAPAPGTTIVPGGHEQLMAGATIGTWILIPIAFFLLPPFGHGGATPAYAASVGWTASAIGQSIPAHVALAAGLLLFAVRTLGHFEGIGEPPAANLDDDAVLQDVIDKVEGRRPRRGRRQR